MLNEAVSFLVKGILLLAKTIMCNLGLAVYVVIVVFIYLFHLVIRLFIHLCRHLFVHLITVYSEECPMNL